MFRGMYKRPSIKMCIVNGSRQMLKITDSPIPLIYSLREVIEKIQNGEDNVDVRKILGTGDPEKEQQWVDSMYPFNLLLIFSYFIYCIYIFNFYLYF